VYVEGRLQTRSWEDKNTGEKKYKTDVIASDIQYLDSRGAQSGDGEFGSAMPQHDEGVDEMPF
jgi:single-strand DNA-binding protein